MYNITVIFQLIIMAIIFIISHFVIKYYLPKICDISRRGNLSGTELQNMSRLEKNRMIQYPLYIALSITIFSILFFYLSTQSLYNCIEISSIILATAGGVFVAIPTLSIPATYWESVHREGTFSDTILKNKNSYMHIIIGLYFIIFGFIIRLFYILQSV